MFLGIVTCDIGSGCSMYKLVYLQRVQVFKSFEFLQNLRDAPLHGLGFKLADIFLISVCRYERDLLPYRLHPVLILTLHQWVATTSTAEEVSNHLINDSIQRENVKIGERRQFFSVYLHFAIIVASLYTFVIYLRWSGGEL